MKALMTFCIITTATLFFACTSPTNQLKDEVQRKAIISELMQNPNYASEVMDSFLTRDHSRQLMQHDKGMMHMMMTESDITKIMADSTAHKMMMNNMMRMIEKDSMTWMSMCKKMMENPHMKSTMEELIKK